jgi:hypothetical protein
VFPSTLAVKKSTGAPRSTRKSTIGRLPYLRGGLDRRFVPAGASIDELGVEVDMLANPGQAAVADALVDDGLFSCLSHSASQCGEGRALGAQNELVLVLAGLVGRPGDVLVADLRVRRVLLLDGACGFRSLRAGLSFGGVLLLAGLLLLGSGRGSGWSCANEVRGIRGQDHGGSAEEQRRGQDREPGSVLHARST